MSGPSAWPHVLVATTVADGAANTAQTFTMNVTSLPENEPASELIKLLLTEVTLVIQ